MTDELWLNYKIFESPLGIASLPYFEYTLTFAPCQGSWISQCERLRGFPALLKKINNNDWWMTVKYIQIQVWVSTNFAQELKFSQPQAFAPC